jgi:hypothetical protein
MGELRKKMEAQAISAKMVTKAFQSATESGGLFYGALEKGASTTEGKIAKLGDAIFGLKVAFGTGFNEGLKSALDASSAFLPQLEAKFAVAGSFIGQAIQDSLKGDKEKFAAMGVLVGTAFWEGFKEVGGHAIVESMRGWMDYTGKEAGIPDIQRKVMQDALLGPRPTMATMIDNVNTRMQPAYEEIERSDKSDERAAEQRKHTDLLRRIADWTREQKMQTPKPLTSR